MPAIIARLSSLFESLDILVAETMGPIPPRHTPRDTLQALKLLGTCGPFGGRFSAVISLMRSSKSAHTEAGELACEALENAHSYAKCAGVLLAGARTTWEGERHVLLGSLPNYDGEIFCGVDQSTAAHLPPFPSHAEVDVPGEAEPTSAHALINSIGPLLLELNYTIMSIEVFWSRLQQNIFPQGRRGHLQLKQHRVEEWTEGQKMLKEYEGDCSSAMIRLKAVGEDCE